MVTMEMDEIVTVMPESPPDISDSVNHKSFIPKESIVKMRTSICQPISTKRSLGAAIRLRPSVASMEAADSYSEQICGPSNHSVSNPVAPSNPVKTFNDQLLLALGHHMTQQVAGGLSWDMGFFRNLGRSPDCPNVREPLARSQDVPPAPPPLQYGGSSKPTLESLLGKPVFNVIKAETVTEPNLSPPIAKFPKLEASSSYLSQTELASTSTKQKLQLKFMSLASERLEEQKLHILNGVSGKTACQQCGKILWSQTPMGDKFRLKRDRLTKHIYTHFDSFIFKCTPCGQDFHPTRGTPLNDHLKIVHRFSGGPELAIKQGLIEDLRPVYDENLVILLDLCFPKLEISSELVGQPSYSLNNSPSPSSEKWGFLNSSVTDTASSITSHSISKLSTSDQSAVDVSSNNDKFLMSLCEKRMELQKYNELKIRIYCNHARCIPLGFYIEKQIHCPPSPSALFRHVVDHFEKKLYYCTTCKTEIKSVNGHLQAELIHSGDNEQFALRNGIISDLCGAYEEELRSLLEVCFPGKVN